MTVNGQRVDLEVQVCNEGDYPERVMYYWARHDEAQALHNARKERDIEIARNALKMNIPVDDIMKLTGLSRQQIEDIKI